MLHVSILELSAVLKSLSSPLSSCNEDILYILIISRHADFGSHFGYSYTYLSTGPAISHPISKFFMMRSLTLASLRLPPSEQYSIGSSSRDTSSNYGKVNINGSQLENGGSIWSREFHYREVLQNTIILSWSRSCNTLCNMPWT